MRRLGIRLLAPILLLAPLLLAAMPASAITARLTFEARNQALKKGACYTGYDNAGGTLGWGQSYCLMAYSCKPRAVNRSGSPS